MYKYSNDFYDEMMGFIDVRVAGISQCTGCMCNCKCSCSKGICDDFKWGEF